MSEKMEQKEVEKITETFEQKQIFKIYNKGLKAIYQYKKCITPENAEKTFYHLQDLISDGKELLFKETKDNKDEQLKKVFTKAITALNTTPGGITETVGYTEIGDEMVPVITMKADNAGDVECFKDDRKEARKDLERQQYKTLIPILLEAHNLILHELVIRDIIKKENPSVDELIDNLIKKEISD